MLALGLQGSPRKKGNSDILLSMFMAQLAELGMTTRIIDVCRRNIQPCKEMTVCMKKGTCPIDDDMDEIFTLLRQSDIVVAASPIFFYNVTAQLKALIDRSQTLWARKYVLKRNDPGHLVRRGFVLAIGATSGKQLFEGLKLTAKYFFDAVSAEFSGSLTYRRIEDRGQIAQRPGIEADVAAAAQTLAQGLAGRRKVLFACRENACRSQMAAAFARLYGGRHIDAACAGSEPARQVNTTMAAVMAEKGIDMGFAGTTPMDAAIADGPPETIVTMGCNEQCPVVPGARRLDWDLPDPATGTIELMRSVRDEIENRVKSFLAT
ncbi:MAG: NAD(P)H-dependent oxidoreductase [Desulfatitalea sp.]|nr:NAD(P)H-dependent oxidoreductase [Desulfatitalea sp.]